MTEQTSQINWVPVDERMPTETERLPEDCRYLVASPGTVFMATREGKYWIDVAAYPYGDGGKLVQYVLGGITHWAELPSVPLRI